MADVVLLVAVLALEALLLDVCLTDESALCADVHAIVIGHIEETLLQEASSAVRDHAIALHLTEAEAAIARASFGRLPCQDLGGAAATRVDLISHHVLETLVEGRAQEDHDFKALASESVVHHLVSVALVAQRVELFRDVIHALATEGSGITFGAIQSANL